MKVTALALPPSNRPNPQSKPEEEANPEHDVFLREVDDALLEDEFRSILARYGKPVGGAIAAGLLILAGYLWWDSSTKQAAGERSEKMTIALDKLEAGDVSPEQMNAYKEGMNAMTRLKELDLQRARFGNYCQKMTPGWKTEAGLTNGD